MSALRDQDPDYGPSDSNDEKHQRIYEENARTSTARKITAIIEKEFSQEINVKEKEVVEIQERLHRASKALHLLRYVIVADFYNRKQCQSIQGAETKQIQIHPAIKQLIGKTPKIYNPTVASTAVATSSSQCSISALQPVSSPLNTPGSSIIKTEKVEEDTSEHCRLEKRNNETDEELRPKKIPRYIPPKSGIPEPPCPSRGIRHKVRKRIIIGNISKWIPPEWREDAASHKWTMYVRGNKENPDIGDFVSKVRFFLHPSYRPNDVVEVTSSPFCLSRRGWGEFPLRVQLHFKSVLNKPMDIIHHLKLDRTYTGLQTLGSETLVDIWIYTDLRNSKRNTEKANTQSVDATGSQTKTDSSNNCEIKLENDEYSNSIFNLANERMNYSIDSTIVNCNMTIKNDNGESKVNLMNVKKFQYYVDLDHDYCGSKYINGFEENLTIDHSLTTSDLPDDTEKKQSCDESNNQSIVETFMNGSLNAAEVKQKTIQLDAALLSNKLNRNKVTALPLSCSKIQPNLRPLKISIPPPFEPCGSKRVLVFQDNKTIPVDITIPRTDDQARKLEKDAIKSKVNLSSTRGISLLKKPPGSDTTLQSQNLNGTDCQRGVNLKLSGGVLLNMNSNVPVLKIADTRTFRTEPNHHQEKNAGSEQHTSKMNMQEETKELKIARPKITLGKDKHKIQSRKELYDEVFQTIETVKIDDIQGLMRFIIRRMPMITKDASDPEYKRLHPYTSASEEEFIGYSIAKQKACEWNRAKTIRRFLKQRSFLEEELWTIKEIMIWARLHGYTPLPSDFTIPSMKQNKNLPDSTVMKTTSTCTEPDAFCRWLQSYPSRSTQHLPDSNSELPNDPNVVVDVVNVDFDLKNKKGSIAEGEEHEKFQNSKITVMELEEKLIPLYNFVCETATEIGIKLVSEEIVPNVVHCAAGRMIMRAIQCLVDDLVRISLAKAWERCSDNGHPKVILLDDVRGALLSREEFDIFTNQGLGSKYRLTAVD